MRPVALFVAVASLLLAVCAVGVSAESGSAVTATPAWSSVAEFPAALASFCSGAGADLSPLSGKDLVGTDSSFQYLWQLCGTVQGDSSCKSGGGSLCQYTLAPPNTFRRVLARWDASGVWSQCTDPTNCPST
jgi:hypothetical protein